MQNREIWVNSELSDGIMNIWEITDWKSNLESYNTRRTGIRFRYDKSVSSEFKTACMGFAKWLRTEYSFPLRVPVYVK